MGTLTASHLVQESRGQTSDDPAGAGAGADLRLAAADDAGVRVAGAGVERGRGAVLRPRLRHHHRLRGHRADAVSGLLPQPIIAPRQREKMKGTIATLTSLFRALQGRRQPEGTPPI